MKTIKKELKKIKKDKYKVTGIKISYPHPKDLFPQWFVTIEFSKENAEHLYSIILNLPQEFNEFGKFFNKLFKNWWRA